MTVQIHPVETEADPRPEQRKPTAERKQSDHNLINLWDERADVGGFVGLRERRKDAKDG
jgi:hypothetical protein